MNKTQQKPNGFENETEAKPKETKLKENKIKENKIKENKRKEIEDNINAMKEIYNSTCTNLPQIQKITDKRQKAASNFIKEFSLEQFEQICVLANNSEFLTGKNNNGWKADFDFLIRPDKAVSILEGKYNYKARDKMDDFKELWEEARLEDEQNRNGANNNSFGW